MRTTRYGPVNPSGRAEGLPKEIHSEFSPREAALLRAVLASLTKSDIHAALQRIAPATSNRGMLNFARVPHKMSAAAAAVVRELAVHLRGAGAEDVFELVEFKRKSRKK